MFLGVAFRAFFAALFNRERAEAIRVALDVDDPRRLTTQPSSAADAQGQVASDTTERAAPAGPAARGPVAAKPVRSDAITLLATLQREARLIDLIQEPLDQFSDAQVGAAARPCLDQCRSALKRMFDLRPLVDGPDGQGVEVPEESSPLRVQWVGDASGPRRSGKLVHPGWEAARCELAQWTGSAADANIVAPAQLEPY